jgi:tetratricopeptide (TPR) repeat protein
VPGLRVAARSSAFAFKGKPVDVQEVGTKLHVASVLEGNVRRAGRRLRLTAQLVNAADGLTLWTETYERDMTDVFAVQADIAGAIAGALRLTFGAEPPTQLARRAPMNLEAHDLYLKARFHFNRQTEEDFRTSIRLYQDALAKDSTYALAWAGIADAWSGLADDYLPPREAYPKAKAAALRALALDSSLAEAHASLGLVLRFYDWDYAAGERELQRAIALNPNAAIAYLNWGLALLGSPARLASALVVMRRAELLDPLSPNTLAYVGWALLLLGRYDEAVRQCRQALELDPQFSYGLGYMGQALVLAGRPKEALSVLRGVQNPPASIRATVVRALVALGRYDEARTLLRELERDAQRRYARPEAIASIYAALGQRDAAFRWLEKAYQARSASVPQLMVERQWDPIRADPRFTALVKKIGLH